MQPIATGFGVFGHGVGLVVSPPALHGVGTQEIERRTGLEAGVHLQIGSVLITSLHKSKEEQDDDEE